MADVNLKFRVLNAGVATNEVAIVVDGEPAVIHQRKLYIDAEPEDHTGKVLDLVLPASMEAKFPIGAILSVDISVEEDVLELNAEAASAPAVSEEEVNNG